MDVMCILKLREEDRQGARAGDREKIGAALPAHCAFMTAW